MGTTIDSRTGGERILLNVESAAEALCVSRSVLYELMRAGEIASVKIGRLRRIPLAELHRFVAELREDEAKAGAPVSDSWARIGSLGDDSE
jgi:excisionase family DNA binding protein